MALTDAVVHTSGYKSGPREAARLLQNRPTDRRVGKAQSDLMETSTLVAQPLTSRKFYRYFSSVALRLEAQ